MIVIEECVVYQTHFWRYLHLSTPFNFKLEENVDKEEFTFSGFFANWDGVTMTKKSWKRGGGGGNLSYQSFPTKLLLRLKYYCASARRRWTTGWRYVNLLAIDNSIWVNFTALSTGFSWMWTWLSGYWSLHLNVSMLFW